MPQSTDQRGIALPVALFALIVIGALVAGNFFAGVLEQQSGRSSMFTAQAMEAAEAGLRDAVFNANRSALEALAAGGPPTELERLELAEGISAGRQVVRLTANLFLIRATGIRQSADGVPLAARSLGLIVRLVTASSAESAPTAVPLSPLAERAWIELY
ncbi:MAG: hypothetical protein ACJ8BF_06135 [Gemmatimonadales bacterium]